MALETQTPIIDTSERTDESYRVAFEQIIGKAGLKQESIFGPEGHPDDGYVNPELREYDRAVMRRGIQADRIARESKLSQ